MTFQYFPFILPTMKNTVKHALREAASIAGDYARIAATAPLLPFAIPAALAGTAVAGTAALSTWIVSTAGHAILGELHRRARLRAPRPPSPSLRGTPTAKELIADAGEHPRTLAIRLRLGSRLADLAPTLDTGNRYAATYTGSRRIAGRGRGIKGWLEDNRIPVNYSTLMRYKRLAVRLRALLRIDDRIPLEWILPGATPSRAFPADLLPQYTTARRRLARLLRTHRNFSRLARHVDATLGIPRLPSVRHANTFPLDDTLLESTCRELASFLQTPNLPARQEKLRRDTIRWLASAP